MACPGLEKNKDVCQNRDLKGQQGTVKMILMLFYSSVQHDAEKT